MYNIKATYRNDCPASFWITGDVDRPKIGNIYAYQGKASKFTKAEVQAIILRFRKRYTFEILEAL